MQQYKQMSSPTERPNVCFRYLDNGTVNLAGFYLDFSSSEIIPLSAICISGFKKELQLDFQFDNQDRESYTWFFGGDDY